MDDKTWPEWAILEHLIGDEEVISYWTAQLISSMSGISSVRISCSMGESGVRSVLTRGKKGYPQSTNPMPKNWVFI